MAESYADFDTFKRSQRLTDTGDKALDAATDSLLHACLAAAESFIQGAIGDSVEGFYQNNLDTYQLAAFSLATAYYDNPSALGNGVVPIDLVMNSLVGQLRGRYETAKEAAESGNDNQS